MATKRVNPRRLWWLLLVLLLVTTLWPVYGVSAQSKSVDWRRIDVDITVHKDGTFTVVETLEIQFNGGPFTFGFREIPRDRLTAIRDVRVWDDQGDYQRGEFGVKTPRTFAVSENMSSYTIDWYFAPTEDAVRVFHIAYRVEGGLRYYDEGDQLWWKAVFADRSGPVQRSTVTVTVPAAITLYDAYYVPAEMELLNENTVRFRAKKAIPADTPFEVRVQWPHGVVAGSPPPWQAKADEEAARLEARRKWDQTWRPVANLAMLALGLLLLALGTAGVVFLWYTRGRDKPVPVPASYLPEPPSDLPPALVDALVDESAELKGILATLMDLARRGVLEIVDEQGSITFIKKQDDPQDLRPFERQILEAVMGSRQKRRLSELKNRFYRQIPNLQKAIYEAAVEEGLFPHNPGTVRGRYLALGIAMVVLGFFGTFAFASLLSNWVDTAFCPGVAFTVTGIFLAVFSFFMPRKTDKGAEEAAKWKAFRNYLANLDKYGKLKEAQDILDRYLPYAVALGVEQTFLRKLERTLKDTGGDVVIWPRWYRTYGPTTSSSGRGGGHAMGTPTGGGTDLSDMSRSMGRSLSNLSTSLGTMLAATATTLSSRPKSSSGSGGGGWSGGGSFGGGGGGGGGGGFG